MAEINARQDLRATAPYALLEAHGIVVASWIEGRRWQHRCSGVRPPAPAR
jgi:hypothetical protein